MDRSRGALQLARENCRSTGLSVALIEGDLATAMGTEVFDALVSNPPYLTESEYDQLDASVRDWEPREALVAGADGLEAMRALLFEGQRVVGGGGWLALEVDASRAQDTARIADEAGWKNVTVHDDLFGRARYLLARRSEAL